MSGYLRLRGIENGGHNFLHTPSDSIERPITRLSGIKHLHFDYNVIVFLPRRSGPPRSITLPLAAASGVLLFPYTYNAYLPTLSATQGGVGSGPSCIECPSGSRTKTAGAINITSCECGPGDIFNTTSGVCEVRAMFVEAGCDIFPPRCRAFCGAHFC